jgi:hypothetical protein
LHDHLLATQGKAPDRFLTAAVKPGASRVVWIAHNRQVKHVTKDELRAELERQAQRYKNVYGGEVITYAAQPDPDRKPWRKKPSLLDQAFEKEIEKIEKERQDKQEAAGEAAGQ